VIWLQAESQLNIIYSVNIGIEHSKELNPCTCTVVRVGACVQSICWLSMGYDVREIRSSDSVDSLNGFCVFVRTSGELASNKLQVDLRLIYIVCIICGVGSVPACVS